MKRGQGKSDLNKAPAAGESSGKTDWPEQTLAGTDASPPQTILLISPASEDSRNGNQSTAARWQLQLEFVGYRVLRCHSAEAGLPPELPANTLCIALHAWRSAALIERFHRQRPTAPLVVVLTGTDLYKFQYSDAATFQHSLSCATAIVGLHEEIERDLPAIWHSRLAIVLQAPLDRVQRELASESADCEATPADKDKGSGIEALPGGSEGKAVLAASAFVVLVAGHLREEKDSLRVALAARDLPARSAITVIQCGAAHTPDWSKQALDEMAVNPRYQWLGELSRPALRHWMQFASVLVLPSWMEGGANVVSEACWLGIPVIASAIPGNTGLLGRDYPGLFPAGDTAALRRLLLRAESDPDWLGRLREAGRGLAARTTPEAERAALCRAIRLAGANAGR